MRTTTRLMAVILVGLVAASAAWWWSLRTQEVVVGEPTSDGHRTITYQSVRVVVPATWERRDLSGCEFRFEHWSPRDASHCDTEHGVSFYASATFDPATGPGVRRSREGAATAWSGYVVSGDVAVYVADDSRAVVTQVLGSAEPRR